MLSAGGRRCHYSTELPRRLVFSATQKARGGKKTAGALEETPALFIRLLRKGVLKGRRCRPSFIYALWAPGPAGAPEKKAVSQHSPRNHQGHVEEVVNVD